MASAELVVRHVRQILLWPLSLLPLGPGRSHAEVLLEEGGPWRELSDEFTGDAGAFQERHYREFVTFLPYVQRFLYGQGRSAKGARARGYGESPIRVLRRHDVASARLTFPDGVVLVCPVQHVDLYFFYDVDVAMLTVELFADEVPLGRVEELLYRFGRCYPAQWDEQGRPDQCLKEVAWLDAAGSELARSDFDARDAYLRHVCEHRVPRVGRHWEYLLAPMGQQHSDALAEVRFRQLEYHRLPKLTYLALDDPFALQRDDFVRLGLATPADDGAGLPYSAQTRADFEALHCYDRFWAPEQRRSAASTRVLCTNRSVVMVGSAGDPSYRHVDHGMLGQFRHQYFLLAMIAHFHRAALLMLRDRMVLAVSQLDIHDADSVARFRRRVRGTTETFLRFNHRYFFHEVSKQSMAEELFKRLTHQLGTDALFDEVRAEVLDMNSYLDSDATRRQGEIVLRLTVVTILGLVGTLVTGFLGMNLIDAADAPLHVKALYVAAITVPAVLLTAVTVQKSGALADVMDTLANERLEPGAKLRRALRLLRASHRTKGAPH